MSEGENNNIDIHYNGSKNESNSNSRNNNSNNNKQGIIMMMLMVVLTAMASHGAAQLLPGPQNYMRLVRKLFCLWGRIGLHAVGVMVAVPPCLHFLTPVTSSPLFHLHFVLELR